MIGMRWEGRITAEDMSTLREMFRLVLRDHPSVFLLSDMQRCTSLEASARKFMVDWSRDSTDKICGTAVCGVNFAMRALITMAMRAIRVLGREGSHAIEFVQDEAAGRRWIAGRRLVVAAESGVGRAGG